MAGEIATQPAVGVRQIATVVAEDDVVPAIAVFRSNPGFDSTIEPIFIAYSSGNIVYTSGTGITAKANGRVMVGHADRESVRELGSAVGSSVRRHECNGVFRAHQFYALQVAVDNDGKRMLGFGTIGSGSNDGEHDAEAARADDCYREIAALVRRFVSGSVRGSRPAKIGEYSFRHVILDVSPEGERKRGRS